MASDPQTLVGSSWRPMRGPFARWPRASDTVLAIFVFLWTVLVSDEGPNQDLVIRSVSDIPLAAVFFFAVASGALYWRRQQPLVALGVNLAVLIALTGLGYPNSVWAMPFALYSVGRYATDHRWSYVGVGVSLTLPAITSLVDGEPASSVAFGLVFVFLIWYIGRYVRVRADYLRLLQERAAQLEREQAAEARRAVTEERARIARELHDVIR